MAEQWALMVSEAELKQIYPGKVVKAKGDFFELYNKGLLGNRALVWDTLEEVRASSWRGDICIRGMGIPREDVKYNIPFEKAADAVKELCDKGYPQEILRFNQSMPDKHLVLQGEVRRNHTGLELTYSTVKKPMIQALKEKRELASGLIAKMIIQNAMDPSSLADLEALLDIYDGAVVEFSAYDINVGDIPNRNTVFWEVRHY